MAFESTAEYYEVLANAPQRLEREGPFLRECLASAPGRRVLDLACGTGIHALFFAEEGADVTAMDLSADMVRHAQRLRPHPRIRYEIGDMRHAEGEPVDLAVCLGNSLSLLANIDDLDRALGSVARRLVPGGLCLSQTLNYAHPKAQEPRHRVERAEWEGVSVVAAKSLVPHGQNTLLSLAFYADDGRKIRSVAETTILRNWTYEELAEACRRHGLQPEAAHGNFAKAPYAAETSPDLILLCRR